MAKHTHNEFHLPPNSWIPIFTALSLAATLIGVLNEVRDLIGPSLLVVGVIGLIACLAQWYRSARNEYNDLPD